MMLTFIGCATGQVPKDRPRTYAYPEVEAEWILNGEPIEFENERWYPADSAENLLDEEVTPVGIWKGVEFFTGRLDVRPYIRLYTKFDKNKFRIYEKNRR